MKTTEQEETTLYSCNLCCKVLLISLVEEIYLTLQVQKEAGQKVLYYFSCVSHKVVIHQTKMHFKAKIVEFLGDVMSLFLFLSAGIGDHIREILGLVN